MSEGKVSLCTRCIKKEKCSLYKKNPTAMVTDCGRLQLSEEDQVIWKALVEETASEILKKK